MAGALSILLGLKVDRSPRMVDFAQWGEAVSRTIGRPDGEFVELFQLNQNKSSEISLSSSPVALAVLGLVEQLSEWVGTATALLDELEDRTRAGHRRIGWPKSPQGLSGALRRAAPGLRSMGVSVEFTLASDRNKTRMIIIRPAPVLSPA